MRIKVCYILSFIEKSLAFEWIVRYINHYKIELSFILLNNKDTEIEDFLIKKNINVYRVDYTNKFNIFWAFWKTRKLLKSNKIDVVHCHLFDACIVGLLAAKSVGITKRLHTRHNSTIHHNYFPRAVWYDKFINYLSSDIIAISHVVEKVLTTMEGVSHSKISLIYHGFDFSEIPKKNDDRVLVLRKKYNINEDSFVVGVISRYIHWKGVQYIIPAFQKVLRTHPKAKLVLSNAHGPYSRELKKLLDPLPPDSYLEISFENDVFALYQLFDVFVHTPIDEFSEAFGQTYIEALASGIPSVVTMSGIAHELIKNEENALVVGYKNDHDICNAINRLTNDKSLKNRIIENGTKSVKNQFKIDKMIKKLEKLYKSQEQ